MRIPLFPQPPDACSMCGARKKGADLEVVGERRVCYNCLKKLVREEAHVEPRRDLTLSLVVAAFCFALIGVGFLYDKAYLVPKVIANLKGEATPEFAQALFLALIFFYEAFNIAMTNRSSFPTGLALGIALLIYTVLRWDSLTPYFFIFAYVLPLLALLFLILGRKSLTS